MKMKLKDQLTTEQLRGLFSSNFDLAQCAINLGRHYLRSGHEISVEELLLEIYKHPLKYQQGEFEEFEEEEKEDEEALPS